MADELIFFIFVLAIGLTHGLEPAHGWPMALLYSSEMKNKYQKAFISSSLIALAHFSSSIFAVIIYVIINQYLLIDSKFLLVIAFILLLLMAIISLKEFFIRKAELHIDHTHDREIDKEHEHPHTHEGIGEHTHFHRHFSKKPLSLKGLIIFAFILGFAHEEEFALLGIAFTGINPYLLMMFYGIGVYFSLVAITLVSLKFYDFIKRKADGIEKFLPLINFFSFLILGIIILTDIFLN